MISEVEKRKNYLSKVTRITIKVGTSTLTHPSGLLNLERIEQLVRQIAALHNRGYEIILVTSGAIGAGMGKLSLKEKPKSIPEKQAAAAVGQGILLHMYEKLFSEYGVIIAQLLLTKEDIESQDKADNIKNTFNALLSEKVIPVINENDAVAVDEIKFGDNDTLSALVSKLVGGNLLILLSDIEGLYDKDPHFFPDAVLVSRVENIDKNIMESAGGSGSSLGTGGMLTKVKAASIATSSKCAMVIVDGSKRDILLSILDGIDVGTWFESKQK